MQVHKPNTTARCQPPSCTPTKQVKSGTEHNAQEKGNRLKRSTSRCLLAKDKTSIHENRAEQKSVGENIVFCDPIQFQAKLDGSTKMPWLLKTFINLHARWLLTCLPLSSVLAALMYVSYRAPLLSLAAWAGAGSGVQGWQAAAPKNAGLFKCLYNILLSIFWC